NGSQNTRRSSLGTQWYRLTYRPFHQRLTREQSPPSTLQLPLSTLPSQLQQAGFFKVPSKGKTKVDGDDDDARSGADGEVTDAKEGQKKERKRNKEKTKGKMPANQTIPPRVALSNLFPDMQFPTGEVVDRVVEENLQRTTAEEIRHQAVLDDMDDEFLSDYRKAAEVHRQVRKHVQTIAKPGITMTELAQEIEDGVRALVGHQGLETGDALEVGMGFPTGLCLNHIAAHWTPNFGNKEVVLRNDDVLKIDFGVHVGGRIVDSAFTLAFNPVYCEAGTDAHMDHLSEVMQEVMESYEVEIQGKTVPVKAVRNITGHNILRYRIHGDKQVPFYKTKTSQHANFGSIVFAKRYLERIGVKNYHLGMRSLVQHGVVESYAALVDIPGSYVAQFEHTVLLRPNCKEIVSRGDDY
ncbi:methionine aminopeptidase, partial [Paraphaeosphaeria minitans]